MKAVLVGSEGCAGRRDKEWVTPCGLWCFLAVLLPVGMECLNTDLQEELGIKLERCREADHKVGRCCRRIEDGAADFMRRWHGGEIRDVDQEGRWGGGSCQQGD